MTDLFSPYLEEETVDSKNYSADDYDFTIHTLAGAAIKPGDVVIVEVATATSENVLIGGNPIKAKVTQGFGWLTTKNMITGDTTDTFLEPGTEVEIPTNNIYYRVTNLDEEPLAYRDSCLDFDIANEPSLEAWLKQNQ